MRLTAMAAVVFSHLARSGSRNACWCLACFSVFLILFSLGPQPMAQYYPHLGEVFPAQLILSGNVLKPHRHAQRCASLMPQVFLNLMKMIIRHLLGVLEGETSRDEGSLYFPGISIRRNMVENLNSPFQGVLFLLISTPIS